MNFIINLFNYYGYLVLFISLTLELIAFPLPGEALMTYCGYVIYMNKMNWPISIMVAAAGAITGTTLSYYIGKALGAGFFEKHGHFVHLDKKRIDKISIWFQGFGSKLLIMAYFISGIRHVTGYFSGMTGISYRKFAASAYTGAFIWTFTFITLGKVLGPDWEKYHGIMARYLVVISLIIGVTIVIIYFYRNYRQIIYEWTINTLKNSIKVFHSLGNIKALIAGITVVFLVFSALVIGIIQDYLAREVGQFDEIVKYLMLRIFNENWNCFMRLFNNMSDIYVLSAAAILTVILIIFSGTNRVHEIKFLIICFLGAFVLDIALKNVFRGPGQSGNVYTFPSSEVLVSSVIYGFLVYIIIRQCKKTWINSIITGLYLSLCFCIGLSLVYFNMEYPSDVAAGFEFGVVWLSLSIILMEIYRVLPKIRNT